MKAAVCRAFGAPLAVEELELDRPRGREVRVELAATAICHSDVSLAEGVWGGTLPAVYGHEAAGVVAEVGAEVTKVRPGDHVVASLLRSCGRCYFCTRDEAHLCEFEFPADREGRLRDAGGKRVEQGLRIAAFAEEVVVDESQLAIVPPSLSFEAASLLGCGVVTGFGAVVDRASLPAGARVAVVGTGGVGLNCVQGAAVAGAEQIVAVDVSAAKRAVAERLGATHLVDPVDGEFAAEVRALTEGRGCDYAFVTVGHTPAIEESLRCVRRGGTVVVVGMPGSGETFRVPAVDLVHDDVRILGSKMGSARLELSVSRLVDLHEQGRLRLDELISARYPLAEINDGMAAAKQGDAIRNVIVFGRG